MMYKPPSSDRRHRCVRDCSDHTIFFLYMNIILTVQAEYSYFQPTLDSNFLVNVAVHYSAQFLDCRIEFRIHYMASAVFAVSWLVLRDF